MTENPVISVIIPLYNVEACMERCVHSVQSQTVTDIEIILVDDGSSDKSGLIADRMASEDPRIKVIHNANGGPGFARNLGIEAARGRFISFVDSDDWVESFFLEVMLKGSMEIDADISVSGVCVDYIKEKRSEINSVKTSLKELESKNIGKLYWQLHELGISNYVWNKLYKKEFLVSNKLRFVLDTVLAEDLLFNLTAFKKASVAFVTDCVAYHYVCNEKTTLTAKYHKHLFDLNKRRWAAYNDFFSYFNITDSDSVSSLNAIILTDSAQEVVNLYKPEAQLKRGERVLLIKGNTFQKKDLIISSVTDLSQFTIHCRLFYYLLFSNPQIMERVFSMMFFLRYHFKPVYYKVKKYLISGTK